jgi:gliding motility-associated-like protein
VQQVTSSRTIKAICASQRPFNWNGNLYNNSGSYDVLLKNTAGCDSVATLVLTVKPVSVSSEILSTCDSIYTLPDGKKITKTGVYISTLVNAAGCDSIITTNITFNTAPELIIHNPAAVCATATTNITSEAITAGSGNGITLGYWKDAMAADTLPDPAFAAPGTYYIKAVNAAGCFVVRPVTVALQPDPYLVAGADTVICTRSTALLNGAIYKVSNATPVFSWQPVDGLNDADDAVTVANPLHTTSYILTARLRQAGCDYVLSDSVLVKVQPPPHILTINDTNVVSGTLLQLRASGAVNYSWQPADLLDNSQSAEPKAILNTSTEFIVTGSDSYGCTDKKAIVVKVFKNKGYYVPSAFSPNSDGLNDLFRPIPIGISSTSFFRIMNRQGTVLFQTNKYMDGWDGTYKGVMQPPANYVWMLKGTDTDGKIIEMKGNVVLIR